MAGVAEPETPSAAAAAAEPASPATNAQVLSESAAVTPDPAERQQHMPPGSTTAVGGVYAGDATPATLGGQMDAAPKPSSSGSLSERLLIPAEEEAFLRSLGWEGDGLDGDDEEGEDKSCSGRKLLWFTSMCKASQRFSVWRPRVKSAD